MSKFTVYDFDDKFITECKCNTIFPACGDIIIIKHFPYVVCKRLFNIDYESGYCVPAKLYVERVDEIVTERK